ncbi:uncharacterized protein F5891DRAFT_1276182 [Suillus fuscotomentosus]|uniref:Uncharacterized protein n=1 Tax=Suillus fuscotomentosus TaxID=1912939 RepID=A0AAD4HPH7_9AGAM|nr:uncharacterized protein F5891DRAFT_1276182 [Suillus fuscotomentosus]KAG1904047.1 hypothetical protein F5891DRAFT_1276182 [Suillus fuscotomentosus]
MLGEFRMHAADKKYEEFWKKVNKSFFEKWPERRALFGDLPADHILTPDQVKDLADAVESREQQLTTWYRWRKNPARLGRTSGVKGALKFDTVLAGGVELKGTRAPQKIDIYSYEYYGEKVKDTADAEIRVQNVTDRGPKLNKRREVTRRLYSEECEDVKNKVERRYQKAKAKHAKARLRQKSGKMPKINDATKIKAIRELGPMLDRILKYLAYATGGWKFTILMGGKDPSTGEVSVFNYHIGELESGAQFDQTYANFDVMQAAFLAFVKDALAFESTLPQDSDAEEAEDSSSDLHDGSDEEWATTSGSEHGGHDVEEEDLDDLLPNSAHRINTAGMYRMTPQSESSIEDDFGAAIASTDASLPCAQILGDASSGSQLPSDSHLASFNNPPNLPVFDHEVFTALINDPDFNISILDALPDAPPLQSNPYPEVFIPPAPRTDDASSTQYPEVFIPLAPRADDTPCIQYPQVFIPPACIQYPQVSIPPAPHAHDTSSTQYPEVVIPPAPPADDASSAQYSQVVIPPAPPTDDASSAQYSQVVIPPAPCADVENMVTPNESDGASAAPTSSVQAGSQRHHGRRTQQRSQLTVPTSSADEIQPLPDGHRRVRKPFNARERDNDIGGPMKCARHT